MVANQCGIASKAKWRELLLSHQIKPLYLSFKLKFKFNQNTQNRAHKNHNHQRKNRIPKLTTVR
jgi:hypothetical protein